MLTGRSIGASDLVGIFINISTFMTQGPVRTRGRNTWTANYFISFYHIPT